MQDTILVFSRSGDQAGLIARTLRCSEVYCLPVPFTCPAQTAMAHQPKGIILACESYDDDALSGFDFSLLTQNVPVLALGGAAAVLCRHFGGAADAAACSRSAVTLGLDCDVLFQDISGGERMLHGIAPLTLSDVLQPIATATEQPIGFRHMALPLYAIEYLIERNDPDAAQLLFNFACGVCGCAASWTESSIIEQAVAHIRAAAPEGRVLCAVSGGVDSAVCAKLASLAVGDRLTCIFIDTGLLRQDEPNLVIRTFAECLDLSVQYVDAKESFLRALSGVSSSPDKERIASQLMTQMMLKQLTPEIQAVVMGTNFNDILFGEAPTPEPGRYPAAVCEPVRSLFKEEVRRLAAALELPAVITGRQPFPSSGLALRVKTNVTAERLNVLRTADAIFREEIRAGGLERRLGQYYATLRESPEQPGSYAVCLRATHAAQGSAIAARLPFDVLERTAQRILEEVPGVSRIVYDLTPGVHDGEQE